MAARAGGPAKQMALPFARGDARANAWGGKRRGAGRKSAGDRAGVAHRARPAHRSRHPVHVTLRAGLNVLRTQRVFGEIRQALALASRRTFRVVHFSVQTNHVHLVVEAHDASDLSSGVRGLSIRVARRVNRVMGRSGRVWADRYHARALETPREVRNALVYVLLNRKKHGSAARGFVGGLDPCSSAMWFDGWKGPRFGVPATDCPVVRARTWLAGVGWRRHGLVRADEAPKSI
jgi:putative transposase